jgi:SAM-dependent methyltransferase
VTREHFEAAVATVDAQLPLRGHAQPEHAESYTRRHRDAYRHIVETVQRHLAPESRILDFGAGMCDKTAVVQLMGYRCAAFDDFGNPLHQEAAFRGRAQRFAADVGIDLRIASDSRLPFEQESFDMVMAHDVLEHLHDSPREILNSLLELLRPEGFLFLTVPSAVNIRKRIDVLFGRTNLPRFDTYYWFPGPWRGHVREYTMGDLRSLAQYLRIRTVELHGCHHMLSVVPRLLRPLYVAATAVFPGWRDSWCFVGQKPSGWTPSRGVDPVNLQAILDHLNR